MLAAQLAVAVELVGGELADVDQVGEDLRARPRGDRRGGRRAAGRRRRAAIGELEVLADLVDVGELGPGGGDLAVVGELEVLADLNVSEASGARARRSPTSTGGSGRRGSLPGRCDT